MSIIRFDIENNKYIKINGKLYIRCQCPDTNCQEKADIISTVLNKPLCYYHGSKIGCYESGHYIRLDASNLVTLRRKPNANHDQEGN